jgi:hypothetical protein
MRQPVESLEDLFPFHLRYEWLLVTLGHVAQQLMAIHVNVQQPRVVQAGHVVQAGCECRLAAIRSGGVGTGIQSGSVGTAIWSGGVGRCPGQCVGHHFVHTRHLTDISCKLCHVGQLPTLHGSLTISHFAQCIGKWLMVGVDCKWPPFQHVPKKSNASTTSKKFPVKC